MKSESLLTLRWQQRNWILFKFSVYAHGLTFVSIAADKRKLGRLHSYIHIHIHKGHLFNFRRTLVPLSIWLFTVSFARESVKRMDNQRREVQTSTTVGHAYLQPSPFYSKTCKVGTSNWVTNKVCFINLYKNYGNHSYRSWCYYSKLGSLLFTATSLTKNELNKLTKNSVCWRTLGKSNSCRIMLCKLIWVFCCCSWYGRPYS